MSEVNNDDLNAVVARIRKEILPLLDAAIGDDTVVFSNPHLMACWKAKDCTNVRCPVFDNETDLRCWHMAGTYCGGKVQGEFAKKFGNCKLCEIYKAACPTIVEELGEGINNYLYLIRKQKKLNAKQIHEISYLNKELSSAIESLDAKNREIQELVVTDRLTGLFNRGYLFTVLEDELLRCQRCNSKLSLLMMDLDDFKLVNDTHGHLAGDKILSSLGTFLKSMTRKTDRCFRYGGEEFVVVLPETEITVANIIANRIREEYEKQVVVLGEAEGNGAVDVSLTLSIGATHYREGCNSQDLLKEADRAMYEAKTQGKNQVFRYDFIDIVSEEVGTDFHHRAIDRE